MAEVVRLQADFREALCGDSQPFELDGGGCKGDHDQRIIIVQQLSDLLQKSLCELPLQRWLELDSVKALTDWASTRKTIAARIIDEVMQKMMGWYRRV